MTCHVNLKFHFPALCFNKTLFKTQCEVGTTTIEKSSFGADRFTGKDIES